jgi:hypothetical protein
MFTLCEDLCTFMKISYSVLLRMKNISDISCGEIKAYIFLFNNCFLKIVPFIGLCGKIWYSQTGHR